MTRIKSFHRMAKSAAAELAKPYLTTTPIDTIICLEGTEMIGAFLANELAQPGTCILNGGNDISVITPETNANNQMIFRDNTQKMVWGKNILLLLSSVSTGKTINRSPGVPAVLQRPVGGNRRDFQRHWGIQWHPGQRDLYKRGSAPLRDQPFHGMRAVQKRTKDRCHRQQLRLFENLRVTH